jgi:hypothetical protein
MEDHRILLAKIQSEQLQAAFERCWNTDRHYDRLPDVSLGMPALICAALSAEIGLKALLFALGSNPGREHNLSNLLDALPSAMKATIIAEVTAAYPDFCTQLANAENAFVRWRYFYESKEEISVNILFVGALGAAIQKQVGLQWAAA